jgi:hypothetical protein
MRCLHRVPDKAMMGLMSSVLGTHGYTLGAESHWARGGCRALPQQEAGLEPQDTWRYRSPAGRWSLCLGHVATPEPSCAGGGLRDTMHVATSEPSPVG